ncbi:MAG: N-6 DNA methylase [Muribaculaceae bacterium]
MSYSVKSIRKQFAEHGVFYTDLELAKILKDIVSEKGDVREVYDPTCGSGNLLSVFPDEVRKYGQELNPEQAEEARARLVNCEISTGDTLTDPAFMDRKFRHIVANYPFSVKWEPKADERWNSAPCLPPPSRADYAFLLHIIHMMADDGVAAVLGFPGVLYRGQREGKIRQWIVERNLVESVTNIEGGYFEDTKIATAIVVFSKGKTDHNIRFADHESGKEYVASIEEVRSNDFNLSPNNYIPSEDQKIEIDPVAKEKEARAGVLKQLECQLRFSKAAIEIHTMLGLPPLPPISEFITDIRQIINQYE